MSIVRVGLKSLLSGSHFLKSLWKRYKTSLWLLEAKRPTVFSCRIVIGWKALCYWGQTKLCLMGSDLQDVGCDWRNTRCGLWSFWKEGMEHHGFVEEVSVFFSQGSRTLPLLCNFMWSGGTQDNFHYRSLKILLLGSHTDVPHLQLHKDSGLRQKQSEQLPMLLLCLKWKKKICHWSLSVHHFPLQLPLSSLAFLQWDKYWWCVVAPLLQPTQRITFIYCRGYIAICCVFTTWLCVVKDMFATWGLDVCQWTSLFRVCVWEFDVSILIFHHYSRAVAMKAQPAWLHRKIQNRSRKYGGRRWLVRPAVSRRNRKLFGSHSSEHRKFWAFVEAIPGLVLYMGWSG